MKGYEQLQKVHGYHIYLDICSHAFFLGFAENYFVDMIRYVTWTRQCYICVYVLSTYHIAGGPLPVFTSVYVNRLVDLNEEDMVIIPQRIHGVTWHALITRLPLVLHIRLTELGQHWFR